MSTSTNIQLRAAQSHALDNGMVLVGEPTEGLQSAALTLMVPSGYSTDPDEQLGASSLLSDMVLRGAGPRDSRALINDLEKRKRLDKTLIVVSTEFGRPAGFDGGGGRGHHS